MMTPAGPVRVKSVGEAAVTTDIARVQRRATTKTSELAAPATVASPAAPRQIDAALFDSVFGQTAAQRRKRIKVERAAKTRAVLAAISGSTGDAPSQAGEGSLAEIAGMDATAPFDRAGGINDEDERRFALLVRLDPYVVDCGGGMPLEIGHAMRKALGVDDSLLSAPAVVPTPPITPTVNAIPDGFGGRRDTPPPVYAGQASPVRLKAFEADGKPTDHLLRLLHLTSQHPGALAIASDGLPMVEGKAPALLAPLVHGWRHDPAVTRVVTETVRLTREAGRPTWPPDMAAAVRVFVRRETGQAARRTVLDPDRDWQR